MDLQNDNTNVLDPFDKPKPSPGLRAATAACLVFLVVGLLVGGWIGSKLGPIRVVTHTVTAPQPKSTVKKVPVPTMPASCTEAMTYLQQLLQHIDKYTTASQQQRDIASDAYVAIAGKDYKKLVEVQDRQNKLNNSLSDPRNEIGEMRALLETSLDQCHTDLGR